MPKTRRMNLRWPEAGLFRMAAFQEQPPYTSPDMLNVRPRDPIHGRKRGGTRPGLGKAYQEEHGSGTPFRMLNDITGDYSGDFVIWEDHFDGTALADLWTTADWYSTWKGESSQRPAVTDVLGPGIAATTNAVGGGTRDEMDNIDVAQTYVVEVMVAPYEASYNGGEYAIFLRMDNTAQDASEDGVIVVLDCSSDTSQSVTAYEYVAGSETVYAGSSVTAGPQMGLLKCVVLGDNLQVFWQGSTLLNENISAQAGKSFGFGLVSVSETAPTAIDLIRIQYKLTTDDLAHRTILVSSAGGELWREQYDNSMALLATDVTIASDRPVQSAEFQGKLYIADWSEDRTAGTDGTIDATGLELDSASVADWSALGIDTDADTVLITAATGLVVNGTYEIDSLAAGELTLTSSAGGTGTCTFRIARTPKIYDPVEDTLSLWLPTTGSIPVGCRFLTLFNGRLVLAGDRENPDEYYMARQLDESDFLFGQDDTDLQRPIAGTAAEAGTMGLAITAIVSGFDDFLLIAGKRELWVMKGDPLFGGVLDNVSRQVGIVHGWSWCYGPSGEIIFLSHDGVYMMAPGGQGIPQMISRERLPVELLDVNPDLFTVTMGYDTRDRGVHLYLTGESAASGYHWWLDFENGAFCPVALQDDHEPTALHVYRGLSGSRSNVLLGGRDGYIRYYAALNEQDDGENIASHMMYGPFQFGGPGRAGQLHAMYPVLGDNSGDATWTMHAATTAQSAIAATARGTGTWDKGQNHVTRPHTRGNAICLKVANGEAARGFVVEQLIAEVADAGRQQQ